MAGEGILLEAGTNEMELLVFRLDKWLFGINVAKVREIIQRQPIVHIPRAPHVVEGTFRLREEVLTLVNVGRHFLMEGEETRRGDGLIIILEFNKMRCGILVDAVERIHRLKWDEILPPSEFLANLRAPVTGIAKVEGRLVLIADFESVIGETLGRPVEPPAASAPPAGARGVGDIRLMMADDSPTIRRAIEGILRQAGFEQITICNDGQMAWDTLCKRRETEPKPFDIVVTDIEMPRMDGLHLTLRIKEDPGLRDIPVILFSSLISDDNRKKGNSVGADDQVTKLEGDELIRSVENCLRKAGHDIAFGEPALR